MYVQHLLLTSDSLPQAARAVASSAFSVFALECRLFHSFSVSSSCHDVREPYPLNPRRFAELTLYPSLYVCFSVSFCVSRRPCSPSLMASLPPPTMSSAPRSSHATAWRISGQILLLLLVLLLLLLVLLAMHLLILFLLQRHSGDSAAGDGLDAKRTRGVPALVAESI